jgi:membrane fusion protein
LAALVAGAQAQIAQLRSEIEIQSQRVQVAQTLVTAAQDLLAKGYMSAVEGKRREDAVLEHKQNLASLQRQLAEQQSKLAEAQFSLKELPTVTARKIQPLKDQISETEQRTAEGKGRSAYVVRAPGAGRVSMLQVSQGETVQLQHLQLEIVPDNSPLQAELLIPTRAAGFVRIGEQVRFLYDAFPYQNFGAYSGRITELSHTVLTKADTAGPIAPEEPVYKAVAILDRPDVNADGRTVPLQAGMLLKAEMILDRRSLVSWIFDPLLHKRM